MVLLNISFYVLLLSMALARIPAAAADDSCPAKNDDAVGIECE